MERATPTVRVRSSTARKLSEMGHKGESYDRIIHRLIQRELSEVPDIDDMDLAAVSSEPGISADHIDWDEVFEMDDDGFKRWLKKVATRRDKLPRVLVRDDVDPFIRSLIGYTPDAEERLLMKLLDLKSTSKQWARELSEFTQHEIELVRRLKNRGQLKVTEDLRVYLTPLGKTITSGPKKMYRVAERVESV